MKSFCFYLAIPALVSAAAAKCNADNCARALTGTVDGLARPSSRINTDCSSFQLVTEYPQATTITITSGSSATTIFPAIADTPVTPTALPSYAQAACTPGEIASARFKSACSCAGVTETTSTAATPVVTVVVPTKNAQCNADNCARALIGSSNGLPQSSSRVNTDCSSFQLATFYPAATTVTVTADVQSTTIILPDANSITVVPSNLPAYAIAGCTGQAAARFASACSCAGVTETTSTAPVQTATVIVPSPTITVTAL